MGELIRPFCIMLLYQYLLHYGLLFHIMSQYLWLFSLILQGLHKEGECRQLEFWAGKGANIRDLFCTAPKVLKLHGRRFQNIYKILSARSSPGGPHPAHEGGGAPPYLVGPWWPSNGHLLLYGVFQRGKKHKPSSRMKLRRHEAEPI